MNLNAVTLYSSPSDHKIYIIVHSNTDFICLTNLNPKKINSSPSDLTIVMLIFYLDKLPYLDCMNYMNP